MDSECVQVQVCENVCVCTYSSTVYLNCVGLVCMCMNI